MRADLKNRIKNLPDRVTAVAFATRHRLAHATAIPTPSHVLMMPVRHDEVMSQTTRLGWRSIADHPAKQPTPHMRPRPTRQ
jgi:hypothetical protein